MTTPIFEPRYILNYQKMLQMPVPVTSPFPISCGPEFKAKIYVGTSRQIGAAARASEWRNDTNGGENSHSSGNCIYQKRRGQGK
jgi:hypothetical protein